MEVSTPRPPAVPPRRFTESLTPPPFRTRDNVTPPPRRASQSVTPPPRTSSRNVTPPPGCNRQSATHSPRHVSSVSPPTRRSTDNGALPPVPSRWDLCTAHAGHKYTALCTTCVKFLCNKCLVSEIYFHQQCSVAYLNDDVRQACHGLKESLCGKLSNLNKTLADFQTSLCKKRDRMLKKRNETIGEIKHYYNRLRDRLLAKLQRDEVELLDLMKEKVENQDTVLLEKIQQCSATTGVIREKLCIVDNFEHSRNTEHSSNGNSFEYARNLMDMSHYIKRCEQTEKEVAAVRDGFLVIRFFVNSETEQTVLNSNVACVEVLNSRSENQDRTSLESERISVAAQANTNRNDYVSNGGHTEIPNVADILRVAVPPLNDHTHENSSSFSDIQEYRGQGNASPEHATQETQRPLADQINEIINEFDIGLVNRSDNVDENTTESALTNEMILANIHIGTSPVSSEDPESECERSNESDCNSPDLNTQQTCGSTSPDITRTHSETTEANRRQSVAVTVSSDSSTPDPSIPRDDDPPPPYPGTTSYPAPPGPDELPPPYPGTGPPPPYSNHQIPEGQQPSGRRRMNGESGRQGRFSRPSSDTDFLAGPRDIAPPNQTNTPRLTRPKVLKVFSVNEANDRRLSGIYAVASVRGNSFLVVDRWNKKLKYFSETGLSFGGLIFREEPWDITVMTDEVVAVTVPKLQTFYKIKVTENSVITTSTVSTLRSYCSIAYNKVTQLFVCGQVPQFGEPVVDIIGINGGQIIQTFRTGLNSELRFSYPRYVKVNDDGLVIVCDWNLKCLLLFQLDGTVVGRYRGTVEFPLNEPTGIAYNHELKEIYVIDAKHTSTLGAIHIVNLSCRCKEIVRWDNEFRVARSITPHGTGYALGNKSGVLSVFAARQRR